MPAPTVTRWSGGEDPRDGELVERLRAEGLSPHGWSNGPGDTYDAHSHAYHKILYCVTGSIMFRDEGEGRSYDLRPGDRLELPAGTVHSARVGPDGCACIEAARPE